MPVVRFDLRGRGPLERIVFGVLLVAVLVLGFFFLVAALIAGAILAAILMARLWWLRRKHAQAAQDEFITTEYHVVGHEQLHAPTVDANGSGPGHDPGK
jgi:predicted lipid-binding transport protein (Tim44 family)